MLKINSKILFDLPNFSLIPSLIHVSNTNKKLLLFSNTFDEILPLSKSASFPANPPLLKLKTPEQSKKIP